MDPYVGEIRPFAGIKAPENWHFCDGSTLPINGYELLFSLLGTIYGGDGRSTFGLPDLKARIPIGQGQGVIPGGGSLTNRPLGSVGGSQTVALTEATMPAHSHGFTVSLAPQGNHSVPTVVDYMGLVQASTTTLNPVGVGYLPKGSAGITQATLANEVIGSAGGSDFHENEMPFLVINYMISLTGIYPTFP